MTASTYERLKKIVVEQLGVDEDQVTPEASFVDDLNADSLDLVELIMSLEEEFGAEISDEDAEKIRTVQDAVDYVEDKSTSIAAPAPAGMTPASRLAEHLGLRLSDLTLLSQALIHSSYLHEQPAAGKSNERLEFLGDSVISLVVSEALWSRYPDEDEGSLTTRRAAIVSARGLSRIAQRLDLADFLSLGLGAAAAGEGARNSVLAATFEAVTGAIYLDLGLDQTRDWLLDVGAPAARRPVHAR